MMERATFSYNHPFLLESGERLDSLEIAYHISEKPSDKKRVIWICHALTANSDPTEWWSELVGGGKLFDSDKYTIICANLLGSCYGSSGPSSRDREGEHYLLNFPEVTVRDSVRAHNLLRKELSIESIYLMVGGSIGGFQALEWALLYPTAIENLLLIACNGAVTAWGTAFNESQRMALLSDSTFLEANSIDGGKRGLECARSIALLSYRSYQGYNVRQSEGNPHFLFASKASSYQRYQGEKLSSRFDAYSYFYLTKSVDSHNVGRGRGGVEQALSQIRANSVVVGIDSDLLFPIEEQLFLADKIADAKFEQIESLYGHDGFLLEYEQLRKIVNRHFKL